MGKVKRQLARARAQLATFSAGPDFSIGDPAFAEWLRLSGLVSGEMTESSALGLTAVHRACELISGTIAGLPLKVYQNGSGGSRDVIPDHWLTVSPAGPFDLSPFSWKEMLVFHGLLHGESFLKTIPDNSGETIGLFPVHPLAVKTVTWAGADKCFTVALRGGGEQMLMTPGAGEPDAEMLQVLGMSTDGLRGISKITAFRKALQTAQAGESAANHSFTSGALVAGMVTTAEDVDETEAKAIKTQLNARITGPENAGSIAFVNRALNFTPWTMNAKDAEFIESRQFQISEIARMFGLPVSLLSVDSATSMWGTGQAESHLALQRYVFMAHTSRIEDALSAVLAPDEHAEFDYSGLMQGTPAQEINLLIAQVDAGILTDDEARAIRNLPPLTPEQRATKAAAAPAPPPSVDPLTPKTDAGTRTN